MTSFSDLLKCHCDICKETNNICETDGYCFTSVQRDNGEIIFSYRYEIGTKISTSYVLHRYWLENSIWERLHKAVYAYDGDYFLKNVLTIGFGHSFWQIRHQSPLIRPFLSWLNFTVDRFLFADVLICLRVFRLGASFGVMTAPTVDPLPGLWPNMVVTAAVKRTISVIMICVQQFGITVRWKILKHMQVGACIIRFCIMLLLACDY